MQRISVFKRVIKRLKTLWSKGLMVTSYLSCNLYSMRMVLHGENKE